MNAALGVDEAALDAARRELVAAVGDAGMIDAAAVIASFTIQNRAIDATGLPLDAPMELATRALRAEIGTDHYATAANTPRGGWFSGLLAGLLGWLMPRLIRFMGRRARRGRASQPSAQLSIDQPTIDQRQSR